MSDSNSDREREEYFAKLTGRGIQRTIETTPVISTESPTLQPPAANSNGNPNEYRAFDTVTGKRRVSRLRIEYSNGHISLLAYGYLQEVLCTSREAISLIFTDCVVTLKGDHLDGLLDKLQNEVITTLRPFNPRRQTIADPAAPLIDEIKRETIQSFLGE